MARADIKALPSLEVLRHLFVYDPETGVLRWRVKPHPSAQRIKPGDVAGTVGIKHGYLVVGISRVYYYVHRIIWKMQTGADPVDQIDHRDGGKLNNRWLNLRAADNGKNRWNTKLAKNNRSGVKGVTFEHGRAWLAQIGKDRAQIRLGRFKNFDDAVAARRDAEIRLHGEFARST